jgi:hypothetical protein
VIVEFCLARVEFSNLYRRDVTNGIGNFLLRALIDPRGRQPSGAYLQPFRFSKRAGRKKNIIRFNGKLRNDMIIAGFQSSCTITTGLR